MSSWWSRKTDEAFRWAEASALRYFVVHGACCADEFSQTRAARYDLERFGAQPAIDHRAADVLVIVGAISEAAAEELKKIYNEMPEPKWAMAIGTCACSGGVFSPALGGAALPGVASCLPVDVFVSGCPPRPEAIIDGWILLQNKVRGIQAELKPRVRRAPRESLLEMDDWRGP